MATKAKHTISRVLMVTASAFIIIAGLKASSAIVIPFLLSVLIAVLCSGPMFWLQKHGVPKGIAILFITIAVIVSGSILFSFMGSSIAELTSALPYYQQRFHAEFANILGQLKQYGLDTSDVIQLDTDSIVNLIKKALAGLGGLLSSTLLIMLTVIFMLFEAAGFPNKLKIAFGSENKTPIDNSEKIISGIKRYLALKFLTSLATGILITIWVSIMGIDFPIFWGILAFLLNFIPTIGSIIAAIPATFLAFIDSGISYFLITGLGYAFINILISNGIEPRIMGKGVGLSTLVVFLSLLFWGWILGPVGMLLSVPLTMTVKIALESKSSTKWMSILLGPEIHLKEPRKENNP